MSTQRIPYSSYSHSDSSLYRTSTNWERIKLLSPTHILTPFDFLKSKYLQSPIQIQKSNTYR